MLWLSRSYSNKIKIISLWWMAYLIFAGSLSTNSLSFPSRKAIPFQRVLVSLGMSSVTQKYVQMTFLILELFLEYIPPPYGFECPEKLSNYAIEDYLHWRSPMDGLEEICDLWDNSVKHQMFVFVIDVLYWTHRNCPGYKVSEPELVLCKMHFP